MRRFAFIINPKAGNNKKEKFVSHLESLASELNFDYKLFFTEYAGHATLLSKKFAKEFDAVVAVGGDGSVNEVASGLLGSESSLGIIAMGSGNGIARHLKIPMNPKSALRVLAKAEPTEMDVWSVGGELFFMLCGLGFDAHIANKISKVKSRGPLAYIKLVIKEFFKFKPQKIEITWDEGSYKGLPFLTNFANGSQFGNEVKIAPKASVKDGYLDLGIIEKMPFRLIPEIIVRMWNGSLYNFKYYKTVRAKRFSVKSDYSGLNIDGEYRKCDAAFSIEQSPLKIKVLVRKEDVDSV